MQCNLMSVQFKDVQNNQKFIFYGETLTKTADSFRNSSGIECGPDDWVLTVPSETQQ